MSALARLRSFARGRDAAERCALCGAPVEERHPHLLDAARGVPVCSCAGCAAVFEHDGGRYRRLPERVVRIPALHELRWASLGVPVGLAFFRKRGDAVAGYYPSALGAVETSVPPEAWDALVRTHPETGTLRADVEVLLVGPAREAFLAPAEEAYRLVGLLRRAWTGLTGGDAVLPAVRAFFDELRARAGGEA